MVSGSFSSRRRGGGRWPSALQVAV